MYCTQQVLIEPTVGLASKHTSTVAANKKPGKSKQNETINKSVVQSQCEAIAGLVLARTIAALTKHLLFLVSNCFSCCWRPARQVCEIAID